MVTTRTETVSDSVSCHWWRSRREGMCELCPKSIYPRPRTSGDAGVPDCVVSVTSLPLDSVHVYLLTYLFTYSLRTFTCNRDTIHRQRRDLENILNKLKE